MSLFPKQHRKHILWPTLIVVVLLAMVVYWHYRKYHPSTDDAYVGSNIVQIAPQITGPILKLYVNNFDNVKKGQLLLDIDPANFLVAYDSAKSQLEVAKQNVAAQKKDILAAQAAVQEKQSDLKLMQQTNARVQVLVKKGQLLSLQEGDKAARDVHVAEGALNEANNRLQQAIATLGDPDEQHNAQIRAAQAELNKAKLNLGYTHIYSSANGYVVNLSARVGDIVQANQVIFSIVDSSQWWVDANFKETQLEYIRPGNAAEIIVDIYPDHPFHGYVEQISRGSGQAFSIFPAENATGNWVKVTQRFPVRVYITDPDPKFPLRIGASAIVTVNTKRMVHGQS